MSEYDLVVVGSGFASTFFLKRYLENFKDVRVLVLERGPHRTLEWQRNNLRHPGVTEETYRKEGLANKEWMFTIGLGGGSNCWTGCTPRMLPNDFRMQTTYGVGHDWPVQYDDLEPYYSTAEDWMSISGPDDYALSKRSTPFPQPPHLLTSADKLLQKAFPTTYYPQATARARIATSTRPACCSTGFCTLCPIGAKYTVIGDSMDVYKDPRVELLLESEVRRLHLGTDTVSSAVYQRDGIEHTVTADLFALGANAIFNPAILLRSGDNHPLLGKRLHEQMGTVVSLDLNGLDSLDGSTFIPGQGYMFYDGEHRREFGACLTESISSLSYIRLEKGRWRQRVRMVFVVEDLPRLENYVYVDAQEMPVVHFAGYSEYGLKGLAKVPEYIDRLRDVLPIESVQYSPEFESGIPRSSEAHIQGTVAMGNNTSDSVVDSGLVHHRYRNLLVLGSSAFPTGAPANPTLTLSALSIRAADKLV